MPELKTGGAQGYLRIATEEAFITAEVLSAYKRLIASVFKYSTAVGSSGASAAEAVGTNAVKPAVSC